MIKKYVILHRISIQISKHFQNPLREAFALYIQMFQNFEHDKEKTDGTICRAQSSSPSPSNANLHLIT